MEFRKLLISGLLSIGIMLGSSCFVFSQTLNYAIQSGDTFWKISQKYNISTISLMRANNATGNTILHPGETIIIPTIYVVQSGDSYWTVSRNYGVDFNKLLWLNNATVNSMLKNGDKVVIPPATPAFTLYTVQKGDTYWMVSQKFNVNFTVLLRLNGAYDTSYLDIGQVIKIPGSQAVQPQTSSSPHVSTPAITPKPSPSPVSAPAITPKPSTLPTSTPQSGTDTKPYITYTNYTVQKGETGWSISTKFGIPFSELLSANNLNSSSYLNIGQVIKIPVHHIPVKSTPGEQYGELLDWWSEAQYLIPLGSNFEVVDFYTGKSIFVRRTTGANHSDTETLTIQDTNKMKEIWGGNFSWAARPVIIKINGRKISASMSAMPHAGNDSAPADAWTSWRSGDYGPGPNYDYIKGNGIDGHFDIHFLNSTRHVDGSVDPSHQAAIKIAAGIK